jgi:hypothetical protein
MPDFSIFKPTLGSNDYLTKIPAFIDATGDVSIEVTNARGSFSTLGARINDLPTKTYVQSQITTGGVDVSTLGNPHDLIRISAAGDTFEGFNPQFTLAFWSSL